MSSKCFSNWTLTELSDRIVPSATLLHLTAPGSSATAAGAILHQFDADSAPHGSFQSFVRIQGAGSGGSEQGYNTSARPLQFDAIGSKAVTHNLKLSDVPVVVENGVSYREFVLDVNQKFSSPILSLDEVRIYLGNSGNLKGYNASTKKLAGLTATFDLDSGGNVAVMLNSRLNHNNHNGDMTLLVPETNFAGATPGSFVYLYSKMGVQSGARENGGFEAWGVRVNCGPTNPPPTGNTASLSGRVYFDLAQDGVFNPEGGLDFGLADVVITLQGVDDLGQPVNLTTTTRADGTYSFTNLRSGTYTLYETTPSGVIDGADFAGNLGGTIGGEDIIEGIFIPTGAVGINYDFTEYYDSSGGN